MTYRNSFLSFPGNERNSRIEPQCFFDATLEVFQFRQILSCARPVWAFKDAMKLLPNEFL